MSMEEMLPLFSEMSRDRFDRLTRELADQDLIATRELADKTRFFIIREPSGWRPPKDSAEEFLRAGRFVN
jgi:hypothetical protein